MRATWLAFLLVCLALGGSYWLGHQAASPAPLPAPSVPAAHAGGAALPTAQEVLASYRPVQVHVVVINVEDTVLEALPERFFPAQTRHEPLFSWSEENRTLTMDHPNAMWRFRDNDTVVVGRYSLRSNLHDVRQTALAVQAQRQDALLHLGDVAFHVEPFGESMAKAWYLGFHDATFARTLQRDVLYFTTLERDVSLWMLDPAAAPDHRDHVRVETRSQTNITLGYKGLATLEYPARYVASYRQDPASLDALIGRYENDFAPGARLGQVTEGCVAWPLKSYDPCMSPFLQAR